MIQGASREQLRAAVDALGTKLARDPKNFPSVLSKIDTTKLKAKGLYFLSPQQLQLIQGLLLESLPIVRGEWQRLQASHFLGGVAWQLQTLPADAVAAQSALLENLLRYTTALQQTIETPQSQTAVGQSAPTQSASPWPDFSVLLGGPARTTQLPEYLFVGQEDQTKNTCLMLLRLDPGTNQLAPYNDATDRLRQMIDHAHASSIRD